jgi:DNA-binding Lrp family transcriptional regulator
VTPHAVGLVALLQREARGRRHPIPIPVLARRFGCSPRQVQDLVKELIELGHLIGSSCRAGQHGLFAIVDEEDLAVGTAHIRSRALASLRRVSLLRKAAARQFGDAAARLFDLENVG